MRRLFATASGAVLGALLAAGAASAEPITISYQPALYWALPFHIATEKGWWEEVGLDPEFVTFPAGAPQIAAAQASDWDVGGTGSVPAILGAARLGLLTIGLTNDESATNALMATADEAEKLRAEPGAIAGQSILLTTNSTADYAVRACLAKWNVDPAGVTFVNLQQAQIITALVSGNGALAGVWAPNTYTLSEKLGAETLCSGADAGAIVPGALVVRPDFAKEHPEEVAKFLAVFLRAVNWAKANRDEAVEMLKDFYSEGGVEISDEAAVSEFEIRPTFTLDEQLALLDRAAGPAKVDGWLGGIASFMAEVGTLQEAPEAADFVDPSYMKMVADDAELAAFARRAD